jgi:malonyl-CoA decarboxylase
LDFTSILRRKSKPARRSESAAKGPDASRSLRRLVSICRDLLAENDGISNAARATDAIRLYDALDRPGRIAFFDILIRDFSPNPDDLVRAADEYRQDPSPANLRRLQEMVEPPRQELFRRLNMAVGGTRALVEMRHFALSELGSDSQRELISADLGHLLGSWFNSGFLTMERIDWNSPGVVLERLIAYEAVHQIQGWRDLRRRLEADRRCYGFFHAALPNDPLIFVEVALTRGMSEKIEPLIDPDAQVGDPMAADSAIFYSITNCQPGLRGVPLGSSLIKQVVQELRENLPRIRNFATLSPIPGFRHWIARQREKPEPAIAGVMAEDETVRALALLDEAQPEEAEWPAELKQRLLALCAWYLLKEKRDSEPLDAVARFHLRNGARVERINWMGDLSGDGIRQSAGLMANYVYQMNELERNHERYSRGEISASGRVDRLARLLVRDENPNWLMRRLR